MQEETDGRDPLLLPHAEVEEGDRQQGKPVQVPDGIGRDETPDKRPQVTQQQSCERRNTGKSRLRYLYVGIDGQAKGSGGFTPDCGPSFCGNPRQAWLPHRRHLDGRPLERV